MPIVNRVARLVFNDGIHRPARLQTYKRVNEAL
ncbi:hypothetical protein SAMN05428953_118116 [Mesorhizobium muleiense]|uniref:Uncharacterized protein n=1 Tax=Mesorhizobium muleiense TaxID=1004279 RepID=A0A1G9DSH9_9HYPH|nr:hypothetical protein SAMN05428953_118116 [Mesorhizobium muleiense]